MKLAHDCLTNLYNVLKFKCPNEILSFDLIKSGMSFEGPDLQIFDGLFEVERSDPERTAIASVWLPTKSDRIRQVLQTFFIAPHIITFDIICLIFEPICSPIRMIFAPRSDYSFCCQTAKTVKKGQTMDVFEESWAI